MRMNTECVLCFQRQALEAVRMAGASDATESGTIAAVMRSLLDIPWDARPPLMAQAVHSLVRLRLGGIDPYARIKQEDNEHARVLYTTLQSLVASSPDPLRTAVGIAILGNSMDAAPAHARDGRADVVSAVDTPLAIDHTPALSAALSGASRVLVLADNAGEIFCDRLLIETIRTLYGDKDVVVGVKGGPILNDATEADAVAAGIDRLPGCTLAYVSNGEAGTGLARESPSFRAYLDTFDVVMAKGQGNYEMLSDESDVFFLFKVKCPLVARHAGVPVGSLVCGRAV